MDGNFARLKHRVESISDTEEKEVARAMSVLVMAFFVGSKPKLLAKNSGYPKTFIDSIATHMQKAGLWRRGRVDAGEWVDDQGEEPILKYKRLWAQALVALGKLRRYRTSGGFLYVDASTGEPVWEWNNAGEELS